MKRLEEIRRFLTEYATHGGSHPELIHGVGLPEGEEAFIRASTLTMLLWVAEAVKPWIRESEHGVYLNSPFVDPDQAEALKALKEDV